jgi:7-carboxy-7-deazaguanine synthase
VNTPAPPSRPRAAAIEAFWSVQGEGRFVGVGMAFLRLATCPIRCRYCDTPHSYAASPTFQVLPAGREPYAQRNPLDVESAVALCREVAPDRRLGAVSLTGGEPLAHAAFVAAFGHAWRAAGGRVHLETAALDPEAMATVLPVIDHLSADYKLPGTLREGDPRPAHVACLEHAIARPEGERPTIDVKLVLTPDVAAADVERAFADLLPFRTAICLVLQPVTPFGDVPVGLDAGALDRHHRDALARGFDVRVLPQVHKSLGVP